MALCGSLIFDKGLLLHKLFILILIDTKINQTIFRSSLVTPIRAVQPHFHIDTRLEQSALFQI